MKKYLVAAAVLAVALLLCQMSSLSLAQEAEKAEEVEKTEKAEEVEYSWGTVSSISADQLVVKEYDYDSDAEIDVTYIVDSNLKLKNVDSLKNITVGSSVEIDYVTKGDKKMAKVISVEPSYEESYTPAETEREEPEVSTEEIEY